MNHLLQSRRAWFLLLCCLGLLTGCRIEEPAPTTSSSGGGNIPTGRILPGSRR